MSCFYGNIVKYLEKAYAHFHFKNSLNNKQPDNFITASVEEDIQAQTISADEFRDAVNIQFGNRWIQYRVPDKGKRTEKINPTIEIVHAAPDTTMRNDKTSAFSVVNPDISDKKKGTEFIIRNYVYDNTGHISGWEDHQYKTSLNIDTEVALRENADNVLTKGLESANNDINTLNQGLSSTNAALQEEIKNRKSSAADASKTVNAKLDSLVAEDNHIKNTMNTFITQTYPTDKQALIKDINEGRKAIETDLNNQIKDQNQKMTTMYNGLGTEVEQLKIVDRDMNLDIISKYEKLLGKKSDEWQTGDDLKTLIGQDHNKSIRNIVDEIVSAVVAGAPESLDTLKEIADWIAKHPESVAEINKNIAEEAKARTEADKALQTALDTEIKNRTSDNSAINTALSNEVKRATKAEETLTTNLNNEIARATKIDKDHALKLDDIKKNYSTTTVIDKKDAAILASAKAYADTYGGVGGVTGFTHTYTDDGALVLSVTVKESV